MTREDLRGIEEVGGRAIVPNGLVKGSERAKFGEVGISSWGLLNAIGSDVELGGVGPRTGEVGEVSLGMMVNSERARSVPFRAGSNVELCIPVPSKGAASSVVEVKVVPAGPARGAETARGPDSLFDPRLWPPPPPPEGRRSSPTTPPRDLIFSPPVEALRTRARDSSLLLQPSTSRRKNLVPGLSWNGFDDASYQLIKMVQWGKGDVLLHQQSFPRETRSSRRSTRET